MAQADDAAWPDDKFLGAVAFAARAHAGQVRKDGQTPYASHAFRVCFILRDLFGITDRAALAAALLHDTLEDTTVDFDDLAGQFGAPVARYVAALTKDSRLPEEEREAAYCAGLSQAPWQVKVCKLADIFDNLQDSLHLSPEHLAKTQKKARRYLTALQSDLVAPEAIAAWKKVDAFLDQLGSPQSTQPRKKTSRQ
jgi:guanosine-3',5'-bis(diphosphate) 3'-pyrophosphohydrolase